MRKVNAQASHDVLVGPPGLFFFASVAVPVLLIMIRLI